MTGNLKIEVAEFSLFIPYERLRLLMTDDIHPHKLLDKIIGQTLTDVIKWGLLNRQQRDICNARSRMLFINRKYIRHLSSLS